MPEGGIEVEVLGEPGPLEVDTSDSEDEPEGGKKDYYNVQKEDRKKPPPKPLIQDKKEVGYATFFRRAAWGANPEEYPVSIPTREPPITNVVIAWSDTAECKTEEECKQTVREIQRAHIDFRNVPDIRYHYLVGGDGNLYEGRGWRRKGEDYSTKVIGPIAEALNKNYIEVALIGRTMTKPTKNQLEVLSTVISLGQDDNWLTTAFSVYWNTGDQIHFYKIYDASDEMPFMLK